MPKVFNNLESLVSDVESNKIMNGSILIQKNGKTIQKELVSFILSKNIFGIWRKKVFTSKMK